MIKDFKPTQIDGIITSADGKVVRIEFPAKHGKPAYPVNPAMTFQYDPKTSQISYTGEVPVGTWLSIGWGWHMFDTDMFVMQAYPDIRRSSLSDLWSIKNVTPLFDDKNDYTDVKIVADAKRNLQIFHSKRLLDTGDHMDFTIPLDQDIKICFAVNTRTPDFEVNSDWGLFKIRVNSAGTIVLQGIDTGHNRLFVHGMVLYSVWFVLGFALLFTKRYAKSRWMAMHLAHIIVGSVVFVVTLGMCFKILAFYKWNVHPDYHQIMGVTTLGFTPIASLSGIVTAVLMHFYSGDKAWTDNDKALKAAWLHRWSSYACLFIANATSMAGLINYVLKQIK